MAKKLKKKAKSKKIPLGKKYPRLIPSLIISLGTVVLAAGVVFVYNLYYQEKIYPMVTLGQMNVTGWSLEQVEDLLNEKINQINEKGFTFIYNDEKVEITPTIVAPADLDASYEIITFKPEKTLAEILSFGRDDNLALRIKDQFLALVLSPEVKAKYTLNEGELLKILKANFTKYENPAQDAKLLVMENLSFSVSDEEPGEAFDYGGIINEVKDKLDNLLTAEITLALAPDYPRINKVEAQRVLSQAEAIRELAPFSLTFSEESWEISQEVFSTWLAFIPDENSKVASLSPVTLKPEVGLDKAKVEEYLNLIGEEVNIEAKEGKFRIEEGKVTEFQGSQVGREINLEKTIKALEEEVINNGNKEVVLTMEETYPEVTLDNVNNLGITELIGVGTSDFSGSPRNRRANIRLGADKLDGILIKPEEEFSLLKALGNFEASEGWLPELVIKGNRTIPELGGGACQFGTTMFRAALNTGLPITARRNHSYTVSYYYPIGTDATIYDPAPDMKFMNDTGNYVLLQTKIEGNNLIFEMWGTSDGRVAEQTTPKLYGWQAPPPTKIVETEDLAPGEKKCTERAHQGVSAEFTYSVTYPDGEIKEEVFQSKYKPWQEVCLVGKEETAPESSES